MGISHQFIHIADRRDIVAVQLQRPAENLPRRRILLMLNVQKPEKLIGPDIIRIQIDHLFQFNNRKVAISFFQITERHIVILNGVVDDLKLSRIILDFFNIIFCNIFSALKMHTDDPLTQRRYRLAHLKINQSQKIPRPCVVFIIFQTHLQRCDRTAQVTDFCLA